MKRLWCQYSKSVSLEKFLFGNLSRQRDREPLCLQATSRSIWVFTQHVRQLFELRFANSSGFTALLPSKRTADQVLPSHMRLNTISLPMIVEEEPSDSLSTRYAGRKLSVVKTITQATFDRRPSIAKSAVDSPVSPVERDVDKGITFPKE
ncbi:MAG: hypothetical protein M1814_000588 [Vezdaea aestivalis]|nr:MAG: hypothetical protein M1814_000588 [Vezdaea aestivalis]